MKQAYDLGINFFDTAESYVYHAYHVVDVKLLTKATDTPEVNPRL